MIRVPGCHSTYVPSSFPTVGVFPPPPSHPRTPVSVSRSSRVRPTSGPSRPNPREVNRPLPFRLEILTCTETVGQLRVVSPELGIPRSGPFPPREWDEVRKEERGKVPLSPPGDHTFRESPATKDRPDQSTPDPTPAGLMKPQMWA